MVRPLRRVFPNFQLPLAKSQVVRLRLRESRMHEPISSFKLRFTDQHVRVVPRTGRPYDCVGEDAERVFESARILLSRLQNPSNPNLRAVSIILEPGTIRVTWGEKGGIEATRIDGDRFEKDIRPALSPILRCLGDMANRAP